MIKIKGKLPKSWKDITFKQFIDLSKCKNDVEQLAYLMNFKYETFRRMEIKNLPEALASISFINTVPLSEDVPKTILGYKIAKNLEFETVGQFEDIKAIASTIKAEEPDDLLKYAELVAVYAMPGYLDKTPPEQKQFADQFLNAPCEEVMATGNFILMRLIALSKAPHRSYLPPTTALNKFRRAMINLRARLASFIVLSIWRRKQATKEVN